MGVLASDYADNIPFGTRLQRGVLQVGIYLQDGSVIGMVWDLVGSLGRML